MIWLARVEPPFDPFRKLAEVLAAGFSLFYCVIVVMLVVKTRVVVSSRVVSNTRLGLDRVARDVVLELAQGYAPVRPNSCISEPPYSHFVVERRSRTRQQLLCGSRTEQLLGLLWLRPVRLFRLCALHAVNVSQSVDSKTVGYLCRIYESKQVGPGTPARR